MLELDLRVDHDVVVGALNKLRDGFIQAQAERNEEMLNVLLEEMKRMVIA
jgi:hypothetical protein